MGSQYQNSPGEFPSVSLLVGLAPARSHPLHQDSGDLSATPRHPASRLANLEIVIGLFDLKYFLYYQGVVIFKEIDAENCIPLIALV